MRVVSFKVTEKELQLLRKMAEEKGISVARMFKNYAMSLLTAFRKDKGVQGEYTDK